MSAPAEAALAAVRSALRQAGYTPVAPPLLTEAQPFLDLSGEAVRAQLFHVSDPTGRELALRPEITIPAVRTLLAGGWQGDTVERLSYDGPVFRADAPAPEQIQAGAECLGPLPAPQADAEILALASDPALGPWPITIGDAGLYAQLLAGLDLDAETRARLARGLEPGDGTTESAALARRLEALAPADATALVGEVMAAAGLTAVGDRPIEDIVRRLIAKSQGRRPLSPGLRQLIASYRAIAVPYAEAGEAIAAFFARHGLAGGAALEGFRQCAEQLARHDPALPQRLQFRADLKLGLAYYTGLVFEARAHDRVALRGGRYDRLVGTLSPGIEAGAVGFAATLWPPGGAEP